jgi:D-3-phosphoglycerate dehydrogenase
MPAEMKKTIVITDYGFPDVATERALLEEQGWHLTAGHCTTPEEVIALGRTADALMVQWAPVTREVIDQLEKCELIVRYGIGLDNLDLEAARQKGIPVCNVPDYCTHEVADHAVSLAFALARQLGTTDRLVRQGVWKITPPVAMPPFREMTFATMGYGRIAREVLARASAFGFRTAFYDPFVDAAAGREDLRFADKEELFRAADIISLHLPLTGDTRHIIDREALALMKPAAIVVNTARGALVDTVALAAALDAGTIGAAGLDVLEQEPPEVSHPLLQCANAILTSHTAWYSASSVPALQRMAAEEVIRGLTGRPLHSRVG